jgi:hypothetical protein
MTIENPYAIASYNWTTIMKRLNTKNQWTEWAAANSSYPKGGVSCSKGSFVVNQIWFSASTFVVKIATFAKPANRYRQGCI